MQSISCRSLLLVTLLLLAAVANTDAKPFSAATPVAFQRQVNNVDNNRQDLTLLTLSARGGATRADESDDEMEDESEDEEEDVVVKPSVTKLASSAVKSTEKARAKQTAKVKAAVNDQLTEKTKTGAKKKKSGLRIPYIVGACMNPFTVWAMTKAYFASLFSLDYIQKDSSQDLRSALEQKAKKTGGGGARGRRKMRPGQAKTLSDLPQLNT